MSSSILHFTFYILHLKETRSTAQAKPPYGARPQGHRALRFRGSGGSRCAGKAALRRADAEDDGGGEQCQYQGDNADLIAADAPLHLR